MSVFGLIVFLVLCLVLAFRRSPLRVWVIVFLFYAAGLTLCCWGNRFAISAIWLGFFATFSPLVCLPFRQKWISKPILNRYRRLMPAISKTEREALTAGGVGWEGQLFGGRPDWHALSAIPASTLTQEEKDFLSGPVESLCAKIDNWSINHINHDIPAELWDHLKDNGFFGLIIPKAYGGKAFSALAHSQIIAKIATVSTAVATVASVPNSLGPAELLLHYGTEAQKEYYLPRLARGEEIPCFALTSPEAGSDAGAIIDSGVVCRAEVDGKEQLAIRLNWNKRYITLAPIATLIGVAFKLYDPDKLLGDEEQLGITCALIPAKTPGVVAGRRHCPLGSAFPNGPIQGHDVLISFDKIIGGQEMVGQGWRMLMECLAAGRSISLPSMSAGGIKTAVFTSGAYARIRRQFNTHIGAFGGVQEALARIIGYAYRADALRLFTIAALDRGEQSAVASAISKYHSTQLGRSILCDAMDVHGGKAIQMGPHNYLAQFYIESPIAITVEGANILTRSLIIFGQGAVRCHPYLLTEMNSAEDTDQERGLVKFDRALFAHLGFLFSNIVRAFFLGLSKGRLAKVPSGRLSRYYRQFSRFASAFAFLVDAATLYRGARLKREESLSARLGDVLSLLYSASAVMKRYDLQKNEAAWPVLQWVCEDLLFQLQTTIHDFLNNLPSRCLSKVLAWIIFPLGRGYKPPSDRLGQEIALLLQEPGSVRKDLAKPLYEVDVPSNPLGKIESVLKQVIAVKPLEARLHRAERDGLISGKSFSEKVLAAKTKNILSEEESMQCLSAYEAAMSIIHVDDFSPEELGVGR